MHCYLLALAADSVAVERRAFAKANYGMSANGVCTHPSHGKVLRRTKGVLLLMVHSTPADALLQRALEEGARAHHDCAAPTAAGRCSTSVRARAAWPAGRERDAANVSFV